MTYRRYLSLSTILAVFIAAPITSAAETIDIDDVPGAAEYLLAVPGATEEDAIKAMDPAALEELSTVNECVSQIDGFAGLETRHLPYRVVVKFKRSPNKKLKSCTKSKDYRAVGAPRSLEDLESYGEYASDLLDRSGIEAEFSLNMRRNRLEISVLETELKRAKKVLRKRGGMKNRGYRIVGVSAFGGIESADTRISGANITASKRSGPSSSTRGICTSGFSVFGTVRNPSHPQFGQVVNGAATANHCGREIRYERNSGIFAGSQTQEGLGPDENLCANYVNPANTSDRGLQRKIDLQWYKEPGDSYDNLIEGTSEQVVGVFRLGELSSYTGRPVCISGRTFGTIPAISASSGRTQEVVIAQDCRLPRTPATVSQGELRNTTRITCGVYDTPKTYTSGATVGRARIIGATQNNQFVQGGDSGGPVYIPGGRSLIQDANGNVIASQTGHLAIGSVRSYSSQDLGYMQFTPIDDFDALGITVRTWLTEQLGQGPN